MPFVSIFRLRVTICSAVAVCAGGILVARASITSRRLSSKSRQPERLWQARQIEVIEDGFYRRAGAIPMKGGCLSCHAGFFNQPSKVPKYTGLVISIPIVPESATVPRSTTQQARRQAEILHTSIHATLRVVHDRYYREDEGLPIPAAIMSDVFQFKFRPALQAFDERSDGSGKHRSGSVCFVEVSDNSKRCSPVS